MRSPLPVEAERLVVNTGPLIALGRVDAFDIIGRLPVIFIIPKEVADEIEAGARAGYPVAIPAWATVQPLKAAIEPLGSHLLDVGEAAVIQLAIEQRIEDVLPGGPSAPPQHAQEGRHREDRDPAVLAQRQDVLAIVAHDEIHLPLQPARQDVVVGGVA